MRDASALCLLVVVLLGPLASAVVATQDTSAIERAATVPRVHPGQRIWVTTSDARVLSGRVRSVSASVLEITAPGGELSIPLLDVRRIETVDSMKNGARNGAILGGALLGTYLGLLSYELRCERDCGADYSAARDTIGAVAFGVGVGAGAGALVGLLVDGLVKGRQVVYVATTTKSTVWEVLPLVARRELRAYATLRW